MNEHDTFHQVLPTPRPRRLHLNARRRRRSQTRHASLYVMLVLFAVMVVLFAIPALSPALAQDGLEPGPNDELPLEEYERRVDGWCTVLVRDWGWTLDPDGDVTGWEGGCWRDDGRPSHQECLNMGYEWDCPIPGQEPIEQDESAGASNDAPSDDGGAVAVADTESEDVEDVPAPTVIEAGSGGLR